MVLGCSLWTQRGWQLSLNTAFFLVSLHPISVGFLIAFWNFLGGSQRQKTKKTLRILTVCALPKKPGSSVNKITSRYMNYCCF